MNFQNPYLNPYGIQQPMIQPMAQAAQPTQVVRVNGENGAKAYNLGANSSALLLDESGLMVWLVTADGAGYKTVSAYDITPHQEAPAPDYGSLENRIKRLEELMNGYTADTSAAGRRVKNPAADQANDQPGQIIREPAGHAEPAYSDEPEYEAGHGDRTTIWRGRK